MMLLVSLNNPIVGWFTWDVARFIRVAKWGAVGVFHCALISNALVWEISRSDTESASPRDLSFSISSCHKPLKKSSWDTCMLWAIVWVTLQPDKTNSPACHEGRPRINILKLSSDGYPTRIGQITTKEKVANLRSYSSTNFALLATYYPETSVYRIFLCPNGCNFVESSKAIACSNKWRPTLDNVGHEVCSTRRPVVSSFLTRSGCRQTKEDHSSLTLAVACCRFHCRTCTWRFGRLPNEYRPRGYVSFCSLPFLLPRYRAKAIDSNI